MKYSTMQFQKDWRYAVEHDFVTVDGHPFPYAPGGQQGWNDEIAKISLGGASRGRINSDGTRLAIVVGGDVHVLDTQTWEKVTTLKAHLNEIEAIAFHPNQPNILATQSDESNKWADGKIERVTDATIIIWNLDEHKPPAALLPENAAAVVKAATSAAAAKLAELDVKLSSEELGEIEKQIAPPISLVVTKHVSDGETRIHGRIASGGFCSPSGDAIAYLPGNSPTANDVASWDVRICKARDLNGPHLTLSGHTDMIVWMGWNRDESLFATVSWDGTLRFWNPKSGESVCVFNTGEYAQNWAGKFSPDGTHFAATDTTGFVRIYNISRSETENGAFEITEGWVYPDPDTKDNTRGAIAWHPSSKWLAAGTSRGAELILLDVEKRQLIQKQKLSTAATKVDREELRAMAEGYPGVSGIRFADGGNKMVTWTHGDDSIAVLDIAKEQKWRFGRGGTDDIPGAEYWRDENGKVTTPSGSGMIVWENAEKLMMASFDGDAVRVWSITLDK